MKPITSKKAPVIRRGQRKPLVKATNFVVKERIELVASMLANGCDHRTIRVTLQRAPHNLAHRQCAEYVARARAWLLETAAGRTKQQALADALKFYDDVIASKKTTTRDKLIARQQLDLIFGLHAPKAVVARVETGGQATHGIDSADIEALEIVYGRDAAQRAIQIHTKTERVSETSNGSIDPLPWKVQPRLKW